VSDQRIAVRAALAEAGDMKKRAVVLIGAGASVEYGAPSTKTITEEIEKQIAADDLMKSMGVERAFQVIKSRLISYLYDPGIVHFEQIYHVAHELISICPPTPGAVDEFRPLLNPFIDNTSNIGCDVARMLCDKIAKIIYEAFSRASDHPSLSLATLTQFVDRLRSEFVTRIYTTNYDDFIFQAAPDLYTGFSSIPSRDPK
jgi:hypothetical protein